MQHYEKNWIYFDKIVENTCSCYNHKSNDSIAIQELSNWGSFHLEIDILTCWGLESHHYWWNFYQFITISDWSLLVLISQQVPHRAVYHALCCICMQCILAVEPHCSTLIKEVFGQSCSIWIENKLRKVVVAIFWCKSLAIRIWVSYIHGCHFTKHTIFIGTRCCKKKKNISCKT
jgi:hypothetical protein